MKDKNNFMVNLFTSTITRNLTEIANGCPELHGTSFRALIFFAYFHSPDRAGETGIVVDFNNDPLKAYVTFRHQALARQTIEETTDAGFHLSTDH